MFRVREGDENGQVGMNLYSRQITEQQYPPILLYQDTHVHLTGLVGPPSPWIVTLVFLEVSNPSASLLVGTDVGMGERT